MTRRVVITGLGAITGAGAGLDALWETACEGRSAVERIDTFDPSGFDCQVASTVHEFKVNKIVPKHYRKATKVMARDIELAVAAADLAVRDAGLVTPGVDPEGERTYPGGRSGAHIGAGLIAADIDELTSALAESTDDAGNFDIHKWGREGMNHLTPLWLLKYLPNMLACHVTIIHDSQGPSNTITCGEASSGLSIGESMRVIQRDAADMCLCGGAESKMNPMAYLRQQFAGRLTATHNDEPAAAVRPFDQSADGSVIGEGGGILVVEAMETAERRGARVHAELIGFGAGHSIYPAGHGLEPDPEGKGIATAVRNALTDAEIDAEAIDLLVPFGSGIPAFDRAELAAYHRVFGDRSERLLAWCGKPYVGNMGAGSGGVEVAMAARMLAEQTVPARLNCDAPVDGAPRVATAATQSAEVNCAMIVAVAQGGQNVALILRRA